MRLPTGCLLTIAILACSVSARADDVPKDARNAYTRAHQCFYASGAGGHDAQGCHKTDCAYVAMMDKYKNHASVAQYLRDRYNNVSDQPYETLAAACK